MKSIFLFVILIFPLSRLFASGITKFNPDSITILEETKQLNSTTKNDTSRAQILIKRADLYQSNSQPQLALADYFGALDLFSQKNKYREMTIAYTKLGELYRSLGNYKSATEYIQKAKYLIENHDIDAKAKVYFYNRYAALLAETSGNRDKRVADYSYKAIKMGKKTHQMEIVASSYNQLGYFLHQDIGLFEKALHIYEDINDRQQQVGVIVNIARAYSIKQDYKNSNYYIEKGLKLLLPNELPTKQQEYYFILLDNKKKQKDLNGALNALDSLVKYNLISFNLSHQTALQDIKTKYEVKRKDEAIKANREKLQLLNKKNQYQSTLLDASVFIAVLLGIIVSISLYAFLKIRKTNQSLLAANKQKDILIKEVHHRVKNNFQVVSGLMNMQLKTISDEQSKEKFMEAQSRIHSMALIHQRLYDSDDYEEINIQHFLKDIIGSLVNVNPTNEISYVISGDNPKINIERAIPLGMVFHELVTNSLKYAWKNEDGASILSNKKNIQLQIESHDNKLKLIYSDNGKGLPANFKLEESKSLGMKLIHLLITRQLKGEISYQNHSGVEFIIILDLR